MSRLSEYESRYECADLERRDAGLEVRLHTLALEGHSVMERSQGAAAAAGGGDGRGKQAA